MNELAILRAKKGLTVRGLSELTGLSTRTISRIETDTVTPNLITLAKLATALGIKLEDIAHLSEGRIYTKGPKELAMAM